MIAPDRIGTHGARPIEPTIRWCTDAVRSYSRFGVTVTESDLRRGVVRAPPERSRWFLGDVRHYLLHRPAIPTLVDTRSSASRMDYEIRIRQRTGIGAEEYAVLNIHQIGIEAPVRHVFEELLIWDGDSTCWPNNLATVDRIGGSLDEVRVRLFGIPMLSLFSLHAVELRTVPDAADVDNARYLLYECSGGYPIGTFCLYVRSAITGRETSGETQFFLVVGFNFFGKRDWSERSFVHRFWAAIHNRVTANVLNRFKQLCEWRFQRLQRGVATDPVSGSPPGDDT